MPDKANGRRKKVRLEDVARRAEISLSAASMALADHPRIGEETKRRVREISRELGYRPPREANGRRRGRAQQALPKRVGFMLVGDQLQTDVNMSLLQGMTSEGAALGLRLEVAAVEDASEPRAVHAKVVEFARELDGMLISGLVDDQLLQALQERSIPHVVLGYILADNRFDASPSASPVVAPDDLNMGRTAARYLLKRGHTRIGFVVENVPPNLCHDRWLAGYRLAHLDAGIQPDATLVCQTGKEHVNIEQVLDRIAGMGEPPTAYVLPQTSVTSALIDGLQRRGLPADREAMVVGGSRELARKYALADGPMVVTESQVLAQVGIDRLVQACQRNLSPGGTTTIPFVMLQSTSSVAVGVSGSAD